MNWLAENRILSGAFGGFTNASFSKIEAQYWTVTSRVRL
ncbi:hypothetical protein STZ1_10467 [Bacillus subtilis]